MRDPYSVLGVRRNAGPDEIKAAWRSVAKAVHPDQNKDDPLATQRFAEAGRAYEVLKDPKLRNRYDYARREAELRRMEDMKRKARGPEEETIDPETAEDMISRIFGADDRAKAEKRPPRRPQAGSRTAGRNTKGKAGREAATKSRTEVRGEAGTQSRTEARTKGRGRTGDQHRSKGRTSGENADLRRLSAGGGTGRRPGFGYRAADPGCGKQTRA